MSSDLTAISAEMWLTPPWLLASKNTSSAMPGTEALLAPPLTDAQFVAPVAFQLALDPPPTQYRLAAEDVLIKATKRIQRPVIFQPLIVILVLQT